jgi:hypothetical protein
VSQGRPEERFAFAVVGSVLPMTVEPYDRCGRQRAVDAILHHPDGRTAALEVSSIGPDDEAAIINYLGNRGHCKSIAGLTRRWLVQIPRDFHPADMRKIDLVLPWCEARGARHAVRSISASWPGTDLRSMTCSIKEYLPMPSATLPVAWTRPDREFTSCFPRWAASPAVGWHRSPRNSPRPCVHPRFNRRPASWPNQGWKSAICS